MTENKFINYLGEEVIFSRKNILINNYFPSLKIATHLEMMFYHLTQM